MQLIIAGFHRSGTSMVAQLLHAAGLFLGENLLGAEASNPHGHLEDYEAVMIHESLLRHNGLTWQVAESFIPRLEAYHWSRLTALARKRDVEHTNWGFKDPRVCLFLPLWKHVLPGAKVLMVYRHPSDSVHSLERRHARQLLAGDAGESIHAQFWRTPDLGLRMWLTHNQALLRFADTYRDDVIIARWHDLARGWPLTEVLADRWDLELKPTPTWKVFDPRVTRERSRPQPVADRAIVQQVMDVWDRLEKLNAAGASAA